MTGAEPVAIVGVACRYPDARSADELWETVLGRRRAFRRIPPQRLPDAYRGDEPDQTSCTHAGLLRDWEFDRHRFGVPGGLHRAVDQAHWLALETSAGALADAGFAGGSGLDRDRVGVVLGNSLTGEFSRAAQLRMRWPFTRRAAEAALARAGVADEQSRQVLAVLRDLVREPFPEPGDETLAGALSNTIAGRVCNHFDFHGTGYTVDGACASSLLAVATACRALVSGELDFALAGGVDLSLDPLELVGFARLNALARGHEMRVYDARPTGFLPGEGCGVVALMRAADAHRAGLRVYATIRGWGTSSDGSGGLTRPEEAGQVRALRRAYAPAGVDPRSVDLVEGHGTGTAVGDRVELAVLNRVLAGADRPAALGSVKANIGHTKAAAGAAGLIKAALAVHHRVLPPTTGCHEPHESLRRRDSAVRVLAEPEPWPAGTATAAVSSMGFGGINAHVVLTGTTTSSPTAPPASALRWSRPLPRHEIVLLAEDSPDELADRLAALAERAGALSAAELHDLAATRFHRARPGAALRCALVADTPERLARVAGLALDRLRGWDGALLVDREAGCCLARRGRHRVGLLFPGQAAPVRARLDAWAVPPAVPPLPEGVVVRDGSTATEAAQPAVVRQSLAALAWLDAVGCRPVGAVGHSLGELTALVWAGVLSPEDGLRLAAVRGAVMAGFGRPGTGMAGIGLPADRVRPLLAGSSVVVACFNGERSTTVSGPVDEVRRVVMAARRAGAAAGVLPVSHAFHSEAMRPAAGPLAERLRGFRFAPPRRPVHSTVTGRPLGDDDVPALLVEQLTAPVRFAGAASALAERCDLLVEAGPGTTLTALVEGTPVVSLDSGGDGLGHATATAALAAASAADLGPWFTDRAHREVDVDAPPVLLANPCEVGAAPAPAPPAAEVVPAGGDALHVLRHHLGHVLDLPVEGITRDRTLLGDLHLNSLQLVQILAEVARGLGRRTPVLPPTIADVTVADAADLLTAQPAHDPPAEDGEPGWVRAFEHRWAPWSRTSGAGFRWTARAPAGHWLHRAAERAPGGDRPGLAVWLGRDGGAAEVAAVLRAVAEVGPAGLAVVHDGHPAAAALARSAAVEAACAATSIRVPPDAQDVDLGLVTGSHELRTGPGGGVERRTTVVHRTAGGGGIPLAAGDVCLVTGGATGITAHCAAALAERTGCTPVLVGRSPADAPAVRAALDRLRDRTPAHYVRCDVTDPGQVAALVAAAGGHGRVRGLLHGAAVNVPRVLGEVTADSLAATAAPKVDGVRNLLAAVGDRLALVVGFGSIIGRRGLPGQSEYAVANDLLRVELEGWAARHPACRTRVVEWSVWSGLGMGEQMGVLDSLRARGISPIDADAGTRALLAVVADDHAPVTLLVSGRFPAGPTLSVEGHPHEPLRFSADVVTRTPGVEAVLEPVLSTGSDLYLDAHRVDGVAVLPAVVGLEAMAQAAATALPDRRGWEFTDVDLRAPVLVDDHEPRTLRISALDRDEPDPVVDAELRDDVDDFAATRFRATVRPAPPPPERRAPVDPPPPRSRPHPFYGPLLFHGGRLRALVDYDRLSAFTVHAAVRVDTRPWFSEFHGSRLLLGDIAAHDAAIHVLLACLPHRRALPVHVERFTTWRAPRDVVTVRAVERVHGGDEYVYDVDVTGADGLPVARWDGLRLRATGPREWSEPLPVRLVGPLLSRRFAECGFADRLELVTDDRGITAVGGGAATAWDATGLDGGRLDRGGLDGSGRAGGGHPVDRLAEALADKADEPPEVAAARVACARTALRALGEQRAPAPAEVVDDTLVVLAAGDTRVATAVLATELADRLVVAVALPGGEAA